MSYHCHLEIELANKCEIGTDFSPQLLFLIYPAPLSNVRPLLKDPLKDSSENSRGPPEHVCIYFTYMPQKSFLVQCTCMRLDQMSIQCVKDSHQ